MSAGASVAGNIAKTRIQRTGRKHVVVVINPVASSVNRRVRRILVSALASRYEVREALTQEKGHGTFLAAEAASAGVDGVIAFGGDGTANEVANGLVSSGIPMTCLPGGSANVFCGVTGTPRNLPGAVRQLLARADSWSTRSVDTGNVNGRRFLFTSGAGLDAAVLAGVDARPDLKRRWRQWWFVTEAGRTIASDYRFIPPKVRLQATGPSDGVAVVVQNGRPWTYFGQRPVTVAKSAGLETGSLTATVVAQPRPWDYPTLAWRAFSGIGAEGHPRLDLHTVPEFTVRPVDGDLIDVHVDGDHIGRFPEARYSIDPGALTVLA